MKEITMSKPTLTASTDFLNDFSWQLARLMIMIETIEGLAKSARDLHAAFTLLAKEAEMRRLR